VRAISDDDQDEITLQEVLGFSFSMLMINGGGVLIASYDKNMVNKEEASGIFKKLIPRWFWLNVLAIVLLFF
jgi:hypothetical protein